MAKNKYKKQKNFSSYKGRNLLEIDINRSLSSGDPIPYEISVKRARERSELIPEEIKKEFRDRVRAGDPSVWEDERLLCYLRDDFKA